MGVFEWGLGEKTTRANAALVGVGATRRILVSDTLLKDYSDDEIEVILAHEIAHHVHQDMWTGLALKALVMAAALWGADILLRRGGYAVDVSTLPLLILAAGVISFLLSPLGNGWSRHNERRADRFALDLTRRPLAFISAMRRLGSQNLAEDGRRRWCCGSSTRTRRSNSASPPPETIPGPEHIETIRRSSGDQKVRRPEGM